MLLIEKCQSNKSVTIFCRGGNRMILEETQRSLHDAICVARNLVRDNAIVYGGGSAEVACGLAIAEASNSVVGQEQFAMRAFVKALEAIPLALAENAGLPPIESVAQVCSTRVLSDFWCRRVGVSKPGSACLRSSWQVLLALVEAGLLPIESAAQGCQA